jgi:hypothetical protein
MAAATDNMRVAIRFMKQKAIWWSHISIDEFGKPVYTTPVEVDCRWDDMNEQFINANNDQEISKSILIVDRDMRLKDKLKLGELDSNISTDPDNEEDVWEVRLFNKIPSVKGTKFLREVYL